MPDFNYIALGSDGNKTTGTLTAGSDREVATILDGRGMFPIQITEAKTTSGGGLGIFGGVSGRQLATFYSQMADLLHSGVPLLRSLELLERQSTNPTLASVLRDVRMKVADGTGLAQAMGAHPKVFDELVVSMVRAGQEGGFLEDVLKRTAGFVEHQEDMKSRVIGALAYPAFLMVAGCAVVTMLIMFFVPKFEPIFEKLKEKNELPLLTSLLMGLSHFMLSFWGFLTAAGIVAGVVALYYWSRGPGRETSDALRLKMPLFGPIFKNLAISRFTRILGTMLHNGIPILKAIGIAKDSTGNRVLTKAIEASAENITAGQKLADPLRRSKYFPAEVVEMIAIAEEANSLETVLVQIADSLERRTSRNLDLMVKLLEPMMLLVMAVLVGLVVAGLLLPVFKMGGAVGG
jgi:general secretion pathway protein F/type IV pilus assembly protein PilC